MSTKPRMPRCATLEAIAEASLRNRFEGQVVVGHCLLAGAPGYSDTAARESSTRWPRRASPSCRCRCATCICRDRGQRHACLAPGVTLFKELAGRRRCDGGLLRQHPRSLLCLWRSRPNGGVSRRRCASCTSTTRWTRARARRHPDAACRSLRRPRTGGDRGGTGRPISVIFRARALVRAPVAAAGRPGGAGATAAQSTARCPTIPKLDHLVECRT